MRIGKVPNTLLNELVLGKMKKNNDRVILPGSVGLDFGVLDFGGECCVVSGDPVTGAVKNAGKVAVHVACNDIATCGVAPIAILVTVLLPPGATEAELGALADDIAATAELLGVGVVGGHTEVTDAVTRTVISITAMGAVKRCGYITTGGARAGDSLVMTKFAGIEGTAVIAAEREAELAARFGTAFVDRAKRLSDDISVVREGVAAGAFGVRAMHDVTEGGVYGAAWEMAEASGVGLIINRDNVKILDETRAICEHYNLDAYRLISSGSMLIATDRPDGLISALEETGVQAAVIAEFTAAANGRSVSFAGGSFALGQPGPDELYKVINCGLPR